MPIRSLAPQYRLFAWTGPLVALGCLSVAFVALQPPGTMGRYLSIGFLLGTMFGQSTVASAWVAFGPGRLAGRLPLSIAWVALLAIAISFNVRFNRGVGGALPLFGGCLLGQWTLVQLPLWGLTWRYRLRLRHQRDWAAATDPRKLQFGLRQLLAFTTAVGIALGIGRIVVTNLGDRFDLNRETPIFVFLTIAAILMSLPLLLAALMPRAWMLATALLVALIGLVTACELPIFRTAVASSGSGGPELQDFVLINAFTTAWTLLFATVIRLNGYCLVGSTPTNTANATS